MSLTDRKDFLTMKKDALSVLSTEKLYTTLNKYSLHPEVIHLKVYSPDNNVIYDNELKIDLFKLRRFISEMQVLTDTYGIKSEIYYEGLTNGNKKATFNSL